MSRLKRAATIPLKCLCRRRKSLWNRATATTGISKNHVKNRKLKLVGFRPPSFGVTVLGNSHGFDCNGSTSGYILWVNGRGVMIDPPPFSS